jgi:hypothetical protein
MSVECMKGALRPVWGLLKGAGEDMENNLERQLATLFHPTIPHSHCISRLTY